MQSNNLKYLVIFGLVFLSVGCMHLNDRQKLTEKPFIGVKIYEYDQDLVPLFQQWHDLGINTVFVSVDLNARQEFRDLARRYDIKRFVILPIFYNEDYLRLNPDSYAITNQGEKAIDDWVHFVCPTRPDYRQNRIEYINNMIQNHDPDCISLDFIRYFA
ncbi:MAG: hypothetical protein GY869_10680, partial [Planctomycetes bacterium]|nr:hypothetical protein [Planctomycetota bacterium]